MSDFLLELRSEEIPARMQVKAKHDLARLFADEIAKAGLVATSIEAFATPRRLELIARGLPAQTESVSEERKGPRANAPEQALAGFLRSTGLTREQLTERDGVLFAVIDKPGRPTASVLSEAIPAIIRAFPWPKSMRWGTASVSTESLRWVRPLQGIVALFGDDVVACEVDGIVSGRNTTGHRFHHSGPVTITNAGDYTEKLRAAHVIVHLSERRKLIEDGAAREAAAAGLTVIPDEGLVIENAGLTEWPVSLLGRFDPAFLDVPREVIQLTMRTNQKYFALADADGKLAPAFICTANIDASDGGAAVIAGNEKVLSARLSDAKFFWEQDLKVPLEEQAKQLTDIVFHEKLGTVADKVERVAKLARWLIETCVMPAKAGTPSGGNAAPHTHGIPASVGMTELADQAERAARLCKADLVTGMVGEFPELQGVMGGYYATAQGEHPAVATAIRDHYKPVGQGDDVPTDPVTVAVSLADKLDTLFAFFAMALTPTGSKDPFALRRSAVSAIALLTGSVSGLSLSVAFNSWLSLFRKQIGKQFEQELGFSGLAEHNWGPSWSLSDDKKRLHLSYGHEKEGWYDVEPRHLAAVEAWMHCLFVDDIADTVLVEFFADRLKVQQREAGVRHDLIDAVFALGGEDDLVRLLARVKALQAFVTTDEGANLLSGYKRAANILKKEIPTGDVIPAKAGISGGLDAAPDTHGVPASAGMTKSGLSYTPEIAEQLLIDALDTAEPLATAAIEREDFEAAMSALASLRAPIDAFFETVTVNDPDADKRAARLGLLARVRDAVHRVADFSKIDG